MDTREEIACPACSEMILAAAKKCKHCGEWVSHGEVSATQSSAENAASSEHGETNALVELSIKRPSSFFGSAMSWSVLLNDAVVAEIHNGQTVTVSVPQGTYTLAAKALGYSALPFSLDTRGLWSVAVTIGTSGTFAPKVFFSEESRTPRSSASHALAVSTSLREERSSETGEVRAPNPAPVNLQPFGDGSKESGNPVVGIIMLFVVVAVVAMFWFADLSDAPAKSRSGTMTSEEQATLQRLQDVWRGTCGTRGYDAYSQECAYYVTQKTVEWRKAAGLW